MKPKTIYSLFFLLFCIGLILGGYTNKISYEKSRKKLRDDLDICDEFYGKEALEYYDNVWNPSIEKINSSNPETIFYSLNLSKVYIEKTKTYFNCIKRAYG